MPDVLPVSTELGLSIDLPSTGPLPSVSPFVQLRSYVRIPGRASAKVDWGSGFYEPQIQMVITAAHVVTAIDKGEPAKIRLDFRVPGQTVPLSIWAKAVAWPTSWLGMDVALVVPERLPELSEHIEMSSPPDEAFDAEVLGFEPRRYSPLRAIPFVAHRVEDWLEYDEGFDLPGFSGAAIRRVGTPYVFGVHNGTRPDDPSAKAWGGWRIQWKKLKYLYEKLAPG